MTKPSKLPQRMNFREYWDHVGTENIARMAYLLDTSLPYLRLMRYGHKKPSGRYALQMIEAAQLVTPGFAPDLQLLLEGVPKPGRGPGNIKTPPSAAFLRFQKAQATQA